MKLTLDRLCITSGILCKTCKEKINTGEVSNADIKLGDILLNAVKSQKFLNNITITKIVETKKIIYLVAKKGDVELLERARNYLVPRFKDYEDKDYVFLEKTKNEKKLLEALLSPVVPVGNSTVILPPDGEKEIKVQIKSSDKGALTIAANELSEITKALVDKNAYFAFV